MLCSMCITNISDIHLTLLILIQQIQQIRSPSLCFWFNSITSSSVCKGVDRHQVVHKVKVQPGARNWQTPFRHRFLPYLRTITPGFHPPHAVPSTQSTRSASHTCLENHADLLLRIIASHNVVFQLSSVLITFSLLSCIVWIFVVSILLYSASFRLS